MLYHTCIDLPNLFSGEGPFFFSGQMTGPTYQPSVQHSNPDTPLLRYISVVYIVFTISCKKYGLVHATRSDGPHQQVIFT